MDVDRKTELHNSCVFFVSLSLNSNLFFFFFLLSSLYTQHNIKAPISLPKYSASHCHQPNFEPNIPLRVVTVAKAPILSAAIKVGFGISRF